MKVILFVEVPPLHVPVIESINGPPTIKAGDTTGLAGQKITVTAEIEDGSRHRASGSITVEILANK